MCLYQTPGQRPPPITGRFVNTVTRRWVGAPNGRAPFRFHGAVVGFVDRRLSRNYFCFLFFEKFETFFSKICAHSERYRNILADIFEILTFDGNNAFPLSPVLLQNLKNKSPARNSIFYSTWFEACVVHAQPYLCILLRLSITLGMKPLCDCKIYPTLNPSNVYPKTRVQF